MTGLLDDPNAAVPSRRRHIALPSGFREGHPTRDACRANVGGFLGAGRGWHDRDPYQMRRATTLGGIVCMVVLSLGGSTPLAAQDVWLEGRNNNQTWFRGSYLPSYIRVRLVGLTPAECETRHVVFEAYSGGRASPEKASARWVVSDGEEWGGSAWCEAETRWQLSDATGIQKLRASIDGLDVPATGDTLRRPARVFEAVAREGPRVTLGLAGILISQYYDTLAVLNGDSTVVSVHEQSTVVPMFGVETPILLSYASRSAFFRGLFRRVRVFVGASITEPGRDFFFGITPNPLLFGQQWEEISFQLTLGAHVGRRKVVGSSEECAERLQPGSVCEIERFFWNFPYLSVNMDASGLVGAVLRAIGIS